MPQEVSSVFSLFSLIKPRLASLPLARRYSRVAVSSVFCAQNIYIFGPNAWGPVKMYDKRDSMPALASYRKFPRIETTVSTSCKYAVFHSQLCRSAYRCTRRDYFVDAASRLMRDMWLHGYDLKSLRRKLYNFQTTFWRTSRILLATPCKKTRRLFWHKLILDIYTNATRPVTVKIQCWTSY